MTLCNRRSFLYAGLFAPILSSCSRGGPRSFSSSSGAVSEGRQNTNYYIEDGFFNWINKQGKVVAIRLQSDDEKPFGVVNSSDAVALFHDGSFVTAFAPEGGAYVWLKNRPANVQKNTKKEFSTRYLKGKNPVQFIDDRMLLDDGTVLVSLDTKLPFEDRLVSVPLFANGQINTRILTDVQSLVDRQLFLLKNGNTVLPGREPTSEKLVSAALNLQEGFAVGESGILYNVRAKDIKTPLAVKLVPVPKTPPNCAKVRTIQSISEPNLTALVTKDGRVSAKFFQVGFQPIPDITDAVDVIVDSAQVIIITKGGSAYLSSPTEAAMTEPKLITSDLKI